MTTSKGTLAEQRVVFDCPVCGVHHDGPLTIEVRAETIDVRDMEPLWPGGPLVGIPGTERPHVTHRVMTTSACDDEFIMELYDVGLTSYDDDRPALLHVTARDGGR